MGAPPLGGNYHPLLKVRAEFRRILMEMGFEEMPTNKWVESSFWNFDALFQPQRLQLQSPSLTLYLLCLTHYHTNLMTTLSTLSYLLSLSYSSYAIHLDNNPVLHIDHLTTTTITIYCHCHDVVILPVMHMILSS